MSKRYVIVREACFCPHYRVVDAFGAGCAILKHRKGGCVGLESEFCPLGAISDHDDNECVLNVLYDNELLKEKDLHPKCEGECYDIIVEGDHQCYQCRFKKYCVVDDVSRTSSRCSYLLYHYGKEGKMIDIEGGND
jgi:hypothetical protein